MENTINKLEKSLPTYEETFQEIGRQIKYRKKIFFLRTLLLIWPSMLFFIIIVIFTNNKPHIELTTSGLLSLTLGAMIILFYYFVLSSIFNIEKRIWVDSYFDNENLDSRQSWRIARRLFFPNLKLTLLIFLRYVLSAIVLCFVFIYFLNFIFPVSIPNSAILLINITLIAILFIYFYYLKIKFRYIYFIFLDTFGSKNFSYQNIFKDMTKINQKYKTITSTRTLVFIVGSQVINSISSNVLANLQAGLKGLGISGKIIGSSIRVYGEELSRQLTSYSKIIAIYLLYRFIRNELYNEAQYVNYNIYQLK